MPGIGSRWLHRNRTFICAEQEMEQYAPNPPANCAPAVKFQWQDERVPGLSTPASRIHPGGSHLTLFTQSMISVALRLDLGSSCIQISRRPFEKRWRRRSCAGTIFYKPMYFQLAPLAVSKSLRIKYIYMCVKLWSCILMCRRCSPVFYHRCGVANVSACAARRQTTVLFS